MLYLPTIMSILEVLAVTIPVLLSVAFVTIAERKTMASMQRRLGPNSVGWFGLLQALITVNYKHKVLGNKTCCLSQHYLKDINSISYIRRNSFIYRISNNYLLSNNSLLSNNKGFLYGRKVVLGKQSSYFYSTIANNNLDLIKELYKDRLAVVKPFSEKLLASCSDILDLAQRAKFLKELEGKGGIYIFQYKYDPLVYYVGRTSLFSYRFRSHIKQQTKDKFHVFGNIVGWNCFIISVVEICDKKDLGIRENYYLQKYLPLLNSTFFSHFSETAIFQTLSSVLKTKQSLVKNNLSKNNGTRVSVWVYKLLNTNIDPLFVKYTSMSEACKGTGIARDTIRRYLDTNVPTKGLLFLSKALENLDSSFKLVKKASEGLTIDVNIPKQVWIYTISKNKLILVNSQPFRSIGLAAKYLGATHDIVNYFKDSWKSKGFDGNYLFSRPLTNIESESLLKLYLSSPDAPNTKIKVWAYCAKTLELINNTYFTSMQQAANYFNVMYTTVARHLDKKLATKQGGRLVYLFSKEISEDMRDNLLKETKKATNATTEVWVYIKLNGQFTLLDNNQPFKSKLQASKTLNMSHKTISKFLDTYACYKEFYFFSEKL